VHQRPDKPALIDGPSGRTLTYEALYKAARATASGLRARGFHKGDVLAIYSPNIPEYAIAFFGVSMAGGVNTTINPLYTATELKRQLIDSGATFLVTIPPFLDKAREAVEKTNVREIFVFGSAENATPFSALMTTDEPLEAPINVQEDLVALPYSSGTTGLPKGVMLTHHNLVANIVQTDTIERLSDKETMIGILPFYHIYGMVCLMSCALRVGATVVTMPRFDLELFLQLVERHKITMGYIVPPIVLALAKHPAVDQYDLSTLKDLLSGAAPLPESVAHACAERNNLSIRQGYGLTETSPVTHFNPKDHEIKITSVGPAAPSTAYRVVDVSNGQDVDTGKLGEIWIQGPQVMKGYLNNPKATASMIDSNGWLHTGDIGRADEDGYLYIVDRVKELIKYKGQQVAPAELEAVLQSHPNIADAAVIPVPDEEAGEIPKAFIVASSESNLTADEVIEYVAQRVAPHKKIRRVEFIDQIPKVPSGKILRRQLVERENQH
tara:strand:+ start:1031 stop:2518 length:1488 start_codon:yes stop_codon:yes gene_type:complete